MPITVDRSDSLVVRNRPSATPTDYPAVPADEFLRIITDEEANA